MQHDNAISEYVIGYYPIPGNVIQYIPYGEKYDSGPLYAPKPNITIYLPHSKVVATGLLFYTAHDIYPTEWEFSGSNNNISWTRLIYKKEHICPPKYRIQMENKLFCQEREFQYDFENFQFFRFYKFTMIKNSMQISSAWDNTIFTKGIELIGKYDIVEECSTNFNYKSLSYWKYIIFISFE